MIKYLSITILLFSLHGCTAQTESENMETPAKHTNKLIKESSPYLLQHAHNPVDWFPWNEEALKKAKEEHKPVLVSIGYSSCHWCHVMEHESFEKQHVADIMNEHFVCIKIDREERPDLDQIYMDAVQLMGIHGGWPLNVFLTEDLKPFYGGTYFPEKKWISVLEHLNTAYNTRKDEVLKSAEDLTNSLNSSLFSKIQAPKDDAFSEKTFTNLLTYFENAFDSKDGGLSPAPKFPMPSNYEFLLNYYFYTKNESALKIATHTLDKMAYGGIYDQLGGGFSRYSTDNKWLAPHFEKMLYDNAQLISLYSHAYQVTKNPLYKKIVKGTSEWLWREMKSKENGYYSALDADSEGEEGLFYTWKTDELKQLLSGEDYAKFSTYYGIDTHGNWEHTNILHKTNSDLHWGNKWEISSEELSTLVSNWNQQLMTVRDKRTRPGLDDKILLSWNALTLSGFCSAYRAFNDDKYLEEALLLGEFMHEKFNIKGELLHTYKDGEAKINAFLDDYATLINGYIQLHQITQDEKWMERSIELYNNATKKYFDASEGYYYFTAEDASLIARKKELFDNVIPSSNSIMAQNSWTIGTYLDDNKLKDRAQKMVTQLMGVIPSQPTYMSKWATVFSNIIHPTAEIIIASKSPEEEVLAFEQDYFPNNLYLSHNSKSPLCEKKGLIENKTTFYVCYNKTCQLPSHSVTDAKTLIIK